MSQRAPQPDLFSKKLAAVSYIPPMGILVLARRGGDVFLRLHAAQGTALAVYIALAYFVPMVGPYLELALAGFSVAGFIHAMHGQTYRVPMLGHFLEMVVR